MLHLVLCLNSKPMICCCSLHFLLFVSLRHYICNSTGKNTTGPMWNAHLTLLATVRQGFTINIITPNSQGSCDTPHKGPRTLTLGADNFSIPPSPKDKISFTYIHVV